MIFLFLGAVTRKSNFVFTKTYPYCQIDLNYLLKKQSLGYKEWLCAALVVFKSAFYSLN